jgi:hypothetical protein
MANPAEHDLFVIYSFVFSFKKSLSTIHYTKLRMYLCLEEYPPYPLWEENNKHKNCKTKV